MSIITNQEQDYKTRFTFHVSYFNGTTANELCALNFFATPKEFANPQKAVENSWEIVSAFGSITALFQNYMKGITKDFIEKSYDQGYEPELNQSPDSRYIFKLIDHAATVRGDDKLSDAKEVRVIYEHSIYANDFFAVHPLSIIPIWKDVEGILTRKGIRTILKDLMNLQKYTSRFLTVNNKVQNTYCINSSEL